jgi:hypothetical protein
VHGGTVPGVVVEVVGVVHLGGLVDQGRLGRRRGLVPLRRAGAIACRGEKENGITGCETEDVGLGFRVCGSPSPPAMAGSVEVGARTSRVEEDGESGMLFAKHVWVGLWGFDKYRRSWGPGPTFG